VAHPGYTHIPWTRKITKIDPSSQAPPQGQTYSFLATDPRLWFIGAPSTELSTPETDIFRQMRRRAIDMAEGGVRTRTVAPEGASSVRRAETVELPDGHRYHLRATMDGEPRLYVAKEAATQTDGDVDAITREREEAKRKAAAERKEVAMCNNRAA
jgi:hypothetical protein